jgi:hypothetical protein
MYLTYLLQKFSSGAQGRGGGSLRGPLLLSIFYGIGLDHAGWRHPPPPILTVFVFIVYDSTG